MTFIESFIKELDREAITTRKMLERVPADKLDWKPHEKSMTLRQLSTHVAEIPGWLQLVLHADGMDFAVMEYNPAPVNTSEELIQHFEESLAKGKTALQTADEKKLKEIWTMRTGDKIHAAEPKLDMTRHCFCQVVHHRAQLGVYLRLLNIPIPGSYGPSADDNNF